MFRGVIDPDGDNNERHDLADVLYLERQFRDAWRNGFADI
jgi:hypothetical protein